MIPTDPSCHDCRLTLQDPGEAGGQGRDAWVQRGPLASKSRVGPVNLHLASGCQQGGEGSVAVDFSVWLFGSISWWLVYFSGCSHSPSTPSLATDTSVSEFCFFSAPPLKKSLSSNPLNLQSHPQKWVFCQAMVFPHWCIIMSGCVSLRRSCGLANLCPCDMGMLEKSGKNLPWKNLHLQSSKVS